VLGILGLALPGIPELVEAGIQEPQNVLPGIQELTFATHLHFQQETVEQQMQEQQTALETLITSSLSHVLEIHTTLLVVQTGHSLRLDAKLAIHNI
jgi:hypothetical protein